MPRSNDIGKEKLKSFFGIQINCNNSIRHMGNPHRSGKFTIYQLARNLPVHHGDRWMAKTVMCHSLMICMQFPDHPGKIFFNPSGVVNTPQFSRTNKYKKSSGMTWVQETDL